MSQIVVDKNLCKKDGACIDVCPSRSIAFDEQGFPAEDPGHACILCGHCVAVCPCNALTHPDLPTEDFEALPAEFPSPGAMDGLLKSRRSVREFKSVPVSRETLLDLFDVARRAPTASNSQQLRWIVVDGKSKVLALSQIAVSCLRDAGFRPALLKAWDDGYDFILRGAPMVVVACAPASYEWGKQDCAIALTFLELAAEARGLGTCWAGYLTRIAAIFPPLRAALGVPEGYEIQGGLMLGEPKYHLRLIPPRKLLNVQWV
jgi:nitroreductase/NAD-dependent dihydropyrimidine dehydrogenase PreA subunit